MKICGIKIISNLQLASGVSGILIIENTVSVQLASLGGSLLRLSEKPRLLSGILWKSTRQINFIYNISTLHLYDGKTIIYF